MLRRCSTCLSLCPWPRLRAIHWCGQCVSKGNSKQIWARRLKVYDDISKSKIFLGNTIPSFEGSKSICFQIQVDSPWISLFMLMCDVISRWFRFVFTSMSLRCLTSIALHCPLRTHFEFTCFHVEFTAITPRIHFGSASNSLR